jgi:hypothetical protein
MYFADCVQMWIYVNSTLRTDEELSVFELLIGVRGS